MRFLIIIGVLIFSANFSNGQPCTPSWTDETGQFATKLRWGSNSYYLASEQNSFSWEVAFQKWLDEINSVSLDNFSIYEGADISAANAVFSAAEFVCPLGALGCCRLDISQVRYLEIESFTIDMYPETSYWGGIPSNPGVNYSYDAVALHEAGHAVGMWHAFNVCATCGDLPTMIACKAELPGSICLGCGHIANGVWDWGETLSIYDKAKVKEKYNNATVGIGEGSRERDEAPGDFFSKWKMQCFPNPFKSQTVIQGSCPAGTNYSISVFDVRGRKIFTTSGRAMGSVFEIIWDGKNREGVIAPAGVYFVLFESGKRAISERIALLK